MPESGLDLRNLRTFVVVAERGSFTRAAEELHIAQQAVSQQIRTLERTLGVTLLRRTSRRVEITAEGNVFLADCRRVLAAADRAASRVKAAARGEVGTLRLAYTLTTVWETTPRLLSYLSETLGQVKVEAREVFGADVGQLLTSERTDIAIAPRTVYPSGLATRPLRNEEMRIALSSSDPLAQRKRLDLVRLANRPFELWPRDMAPGFYDMVVNTCRTAGFEPELDERAGGNTVWQNIARGRGVALINASLAEQLPGGIALVELAGSTATLTYDLVWRDGEGPIAQRAVQVAAGLAVGLGWLPD